MGCTDSVLGMGNKILNAVFRSSLFEKLEVWN